MTESKLTPKMELLIEGSPADQAIVESIILVRVKQHLDLADAIEVRLSNNDLTWSDGDTLCEGKKIAVKLGYEETETQLVATGEIVRRDCEFPVRGPAVVTVVAYDNSHRLKRGVKNRTFLDMKDSDIVSQLAGEAGLSGDVEATSVTHKYVFQSSQTNLSFIRERAMVNGYLVTVDRENAKLSFKKPDEGGSAVATLKWGENLLSFSPRMTTDEQLSKVVVRGWDMVNKEKLEGTADSGAIALKMDGTKTGAALAESAYSAREALYTHIPFFDAAEGEAMAKAWLNQKSMRYAEGEGSCQGDPAIDAGVVVAIEATGFRTDGKYYVSKCLQHFEPGVGYSTHFSFIRSSEEVGQAQEVETPEPLAPLEMSDPEQPGWVEFKVTSETGESLEGISYKVTLPNGEVQQGTLDASQMIRIEGIRDPGEAQIELNPPEDLVPLD